MQKTEEQSEKRRRATKGKLYRAEQHEKAVREELAAAELMKEGLETGESRVQEELLAATLAEERCEASEIRMAEKLERLETEMRELRVSKPKPPAPAVGASREFLVKAWH